MLKELALIIIPSVLAYALGKRKQTVEIENQVLKNLETSILLYRQIIDDLKKEIEELNQKVQHLEDKVVKLMDENKKLKKQKSIDE